MEPSQTPNTTVVSSVDGQLSPKHLTKITPVSKILAAVLFIILPFVGLYIGYQYGLSQAAKMTAVVDISAPLEIPAPVAEEVATEELVGKQTAQAGFMVEAVPEQSEGMPINKVYANGFYIEDVIATCSPAELSEIATSYDLWTTYDPTLTTIIPDKTQITDALNCYYAGGGPMYLLFTEGGVEQVAKIEQNECGDVEACSPYGPTVVVWTE